MFAKIKLIWKALFAFKNIAKEYEEAGNEKVPVYLHRRFIHSILVMASVVVGYFFADITIDENIMNQLTDNILNIGVAVSTAWGIIGTLIGQIKKGK
jgi:hypothetical protein